jgi:hypothetical protein
MKPKPHGNGSGKINIHQQDLGGWVRVFPDQSALLAEDLHVYLSHALTEWFRQRPQLRMRCVTGLVRDGNTVELHAWYDLQVFPDLSQQKPEQPSA